MANNDLQADILIECLKSRKSELGLTNAVIADKTGVPESTVTKVFNGSNRSPSYDTIAPIAHVLGVSLDTMTVIGETADAPKHDPQTGQDVFLRYVIQSCEARLKLKDKWINTLAAALFILLAFLIAWLIYDFTHLNLGWVQYSAQHRDLTVIKDLFNI